VESHQEFASKQRLQFDILSDEKQELRTAYEVPKSMLGLLPGRVTFIIGKDGIIKEVFNSQLDTNGHLKLQTRNNLAKLALFFIFFIHTFCPEYDDKHCIIIINEIK